MRNFENISLIYFATEAQHNKEIIRFALKKVNRLIAVGICKKPLVLWCAASEVKIEARFEVSMKFCTSKRSLP